MGKLNKEIKNETIMYIVFGLLTTAVNFLVFVGWRWIFGKGEAESLIATTVAFVISVVFAYVTNKRYVFKTKSWKSDVIKRELPSFFVSRLFSYGVEMLGMFICTVVLHLDETKFMGIDSINIIKLGLNVIVVILNYIFSKFWVFKKKDAAGGNTP